MCSTSDFAQMFLRGICARLISFDAAAKWADSLIAESDVPTDWEMNLAMVRDNAEAFDVLLKQAATGDYELGRDLILAYVQGKRSAREWTIHEVYRALKAVYRSGPRSDPAFEEEMQTVFDSDEVPRELARGANVCGDDDSHYYGEESAVDQLLDRRKHLLSNVPVEFEITNQTVSALDS